MVGDTLASLALSLGLIIPRCLCVLGHVVLACFGFVSDVPTEKAWEALHGQGK